MRNRLYEGTIQVGLSASHSTKVQRQPYTSPKITDPISDAAFALGITPERLNHFRKYVKNFQKGNDTFNITKWNQIFFNSNRKEILHKNALFQTKFNSDLHDEEVSKYVSLKVLLEQFL